MTRPQHPNLAALPRLLSALELAYRCALAACHDANPAGGLAPGDSAEHDAAQLELAAYRAALEAAGYTFNTFNT